MKINGIISGIIDDIVASRDLHKDNWAKNGEYLPIKNLNNDETGEVGELLLNDIFSKHGRKVEFEKAITSDEKDWDIIVDDIKIEVKTATIGRSADTFQHEKFFPNRKYDAFVFLDFTPNDLYVTFARKKDIVWEELTKRQVNEMFTGEYKFDLSLSMIRNKETKKIRRCFISKIGTEADLLDLFDEFKKYFNSAE